MALAVLVPIAAVAVFLIWQDYQARRTAMLTNLELKSAQINAQLEDFVNPAEASTSALATLITSVRPGLADTPPVSAGTRTAQDDLLLGFLTRNPQFSDVSVVDKSGNPLASSRPFTSGIRSDYAVFLGTQDAGDTFAVSDVFVPAGESQPYALFSYPIGVEAYVIAQSPLSKISGALDMSIGFPTSAKSGIFDSSGKVLAGTGYELPHPGGAIGRDVSGSAVWAQVASPPEGAWFGPGLDKIDRIIFYEFPEKTPWVTTVAFAQAELFDPLWQRVWIVSGALLATVAGTLMVVELARHRERSAWAQVTRERQTLHAVLDGAHDGIAVLNASGVVEYANRRLGELFDTSAERLIGASSSGLAAALGAGSGLSEQDVDGLEIMLGAGDSPGAPLQVGSPDKRSIQLVGYPVMQPDGNAVGRTLVAHDVTEESRVQRMKSDFVGHASHQLRTPLASILTSSELLLTGLGDSASRKQKIQLVHDEALRMRRTINSLLNLCQIESGRITLEPRVVDLRNVFSDVIETASARSDRHEFSVDISRDPLLVWGDKSKIFEILSSLVDNAVKFSPDGGQIHLKASLSKSSVDGMIAIQVQDEGVGIDQVDRSALFSPYERASAPSRGLAGGTGLGLHIAHSLVELMGGQISAESSIGMGSTFTFTLPGYTPPVKEPIKQTNEDAAFEMSAPSIMATEN
jgi:signal transduction histidine kinase